MKQPLRGSRRYDASIPVEVRCPSWGQFVKLYTDNISAGGLFIQTGSPQPIFTDIEVRFSLPGERTLSLDAWVAHTRSVQRAEAEGTVPGMGVEFHDIDENKQEQIRALLEMAKRDELGEKPPTKPREKQAKESRQTSSAEKEVLQRLRSELAALSDLGDFAVLGLDEEADKSAIREAYFKFSKRYHPDLFARYGDPEIRKAVTEIFIRMKQAYDRLGDACTLRSVKDVSRKKSIRTRRAVDASTSESRRQRARPSAFREALQLISRKHYDEGERMLKDVLSAEPDNAEASMWVCLCQARRLLLSGKREKAVERYQAALEIDPSNAEAVREVRAFHRQQRRSKGLWDRILGS